MKPFNKLMLLSLLLIALATSCKKPVPLQVKHIPKNASFVAVLNTKSITGKLLKNQATIENILKSATGTDTSAAKGKEEWEELQSSGIELTKNFYVSIDQKNGGFSSGKGSMIMAAIGSLSDDEKLEKYLKKKMPKAEVRKEKNYSFVTTGGDVMVAWGGDLVIAMSYQQPGTREMEYDSTTGNFNFKNPVNAENDLKKEMDNYFILKEDQSVAAIPEFRDLMQSNADASMWVNAAGYTDALPLPRMKELVENTYSAYTINFEDGKIVAEGKSYLSKQLRDIYGKYKNPEADMTLVEKYPSDKINGFFAAGFDPQLISDVVTQLELGGMADAQLTKMMGSNYTLQDLLKAFKGDMAFVASDFAMKQAPGGGMNPQKPAIKMLGNIAIGDKVQMNKILDKLAEHKVLEKTAAGYAPGPEIRQLGVDISIDDKNILIASSDTLINAYKSNTKKAAIDKDIMSNSKGKAAAFYVNIQSLLSGLDYFAKKDSSTNITLAKAKETFNDASGYVNKPGGKAIESYYELRFVNEKENSLSSILKFIESVSKTFNNEKQRRMMMPVDSIPVSMN